MHGAPSRTSGRGRPAGAPAGPAGLEFFFERNLEDALLQQEVGDHLLELLVILLERAQAMGVRVGLIGSRYMGPAELWVVG